MGDLAVFNPKTDLPDEFEYVDLESVVGTEMLSHRTESKRTAPSRAQRLAQTGDLFYQTVRPYQKNNYLFEKPDRNYVFSTGYAQMRPVTDGRFLLCLVQNECFVKVVLDNCTGTSYPAINSNDLAQIDVYAPRLPQEQRQIGNFFKYIDTLITLHQREESCAASFSASCFGTLKAFFWEQRKFSDFVLRESVFQASSSEYPSVEYEDVVAEEGRLNKDIRQKETQKTGIVFDGTQVLYGKLRPYLHNWLNPDFTGVAVGDWWVLRPVGADKKFLYRLIQTQQFDEVANQSSGSKMPRADWNLVSNTEFIIPSSLDEQRQIAGTFDDLDNLITLHQCKPKSRKGGSHVLYSYQV